MPRCRYSAQYVQKSSGTAANMKSTDCSRSENGENSKNIGTEAEEVLRVQEAGSMEEEVLAKKAAPESCLFSAGTALQPIVRKGRKGV